MMHSAKGSISLPCLLAALLLALSAQLCLLYAVKGYEAEKDFLRGQQLRLLCGSVLQAIGQKPQPAGTQLCYEGELQPGNEPVTVTSESNYSSDGQIDYLKVSAVAANHVGAVQRLHRLRVSFSPQMLALATKSVLAGRSLTGSEYLQQAALYTSTEEVRLPQISFLQNKCAASLNKRTTEENGLSARFYYLRSNTSLSLGSKGLQGALIANKLSINIAPGSYYPDRIVLISEEGDITLGDGTKMAQALLLAKGTVTIGAGCQLNGFVLADKVVLRGTADLTPDKGAVEPMLTPAFNKP
jgi:hypothetical protein